MRWTHGLAISLILGGACTSRSERDVAAGPSAARHKLELKAERPAEPAGRAASAAVTEAADAPPPAPTVDGVAPKSVTVAPRDSGGALEGLMGKRLGSGETTSLGAGEGRGVGGVGGLGTRGAGVGGAGVDADRGGYGSGSGSGLAARRTRVADAEASYGRAVSQPAMTPLKAGTTDDNADFGAYLTFLAAWSDRATTPRGYRHIDVRERSFVKVVDAAGRPVPSADVRVRAIDGSGQAWRARTLGDGRAAYYPRIAGRSGQAVIAEVDHQGMHAEGTLVPGQDLTLTLTQDVRVAQAVPLDVLFLIDTTGSMGDEILRIKETLLATTAKVRGLDRPVDLRYGAVLYRDQGDDYVTQDLPFVADVQRFQSAIMGVQAGGGGDTPEDLDAGLARAVNLKTWRPDAAKLVFLIADAPPHLDYPQSVHYADSLQRALSSGIRVHSVAASGLDPFGSLVFRQIAQYTGGKFIFIEYGGNIAASAAAHGVAGQVSSNNLDDILFREIKAEVIGFGT